MMIFQYRNCLEIKFRYVFNKKNTHTRSTAVQFATEHAELLAPNWWYYSFWWYRAKFVERERLQIAVQIAALNGMKWCVLKVANT